jgi:hypothetical protein
LSSLYKLTSITSEIQQGQLYGHVDEHRTLKDNIFLPMYISKYQAFQKEAEISNLVEPDNTLDMLLQIGAYRKAGRNLPWKKPQQQTSPYQVQKRIISEPLHDNGPGPGETADSGVPPGPVPGVL